MTLVVLFWLETSGCDQNFQRVEPQCLHCFLKTRKSTKTQDVLRLLRLLITASKKNTCNSITESRKSKVSLASSLAHGGICLSKS